MKNFNPILVGLFGSVVATGCFAQQGPIPIVGLVELSGTGATFNNLVGGTTLGLFGHIFGTDLLVAPLFADSISRRLVYTPPGTWIDYQSGRTYEGARWHEIEAGQIPIVLLVRNHAAIAHAALAQSTGSINWNQLELRVFSTDSATSSGEVTPGDTGDVRTVRVANGRVVGDPFNGTVRWRVTRQPLAP